MKDWFTLEPDVVKLLNKHYTPGRGGNKIDKVVIHHNAGVLSIDQIWNVWQDRQASAHYQIETGGRIGQLVWDRDTAWHAANSHINSTSIGLEFANSAGAAQDWPITDTTIVEGGKLAGAVCYYYKLGRPNAGTNIRFHREFTSTSCPYHLAPGGKYHAKLMKAAQDHYDWMVAGGKQTPEQELEAMSKEIEKVHYELTNRFRSRYVDPDTGQQSDFADTLVGYMLEMDRKVETITSDILPKMSKRLDEIAAEVKKGK